MLPSSIKFLLKLEILCLDNCRKLHSLPELPIDIKEFHAENCTSLVTVSSLKTFSENMKGKEKYISFKNGMMMNDHIAEDVIFIMESSALHNILVTRYGMDTHSYNYNSAVVCLPGSTIPWQFKYKSDSSIVTVGCRDTYFPFGHIYAVVISPSNEMNNQHGTGAKIQCTCHCEDKFVTEWSSEPITNLNMDHIFVWYDPYRWIESIPYYHFRPVCFEFNLKTDMSDNDGFFSIKECGVLPIYSSALPSVLSRNYLSEDERSYLRKKIEDKWQRYLDRPE
jgi:hypothetical protein